MDRSLQAMGGAARELKVLIVAEHTSAVFGGEAAIPLHLFRVLRARGVEAWLVTHSRTRRELARLFPADGARIFYIPDTRMHLFLAFWDRLNLGRIHYYTNGLLSGLLTQWMQRKIARRLVREKGIDVVHQPIPVSPKEFSLIRRMGAPVVMGPFNGGMTFPPGFASREGKMARRLMTLGRTISTVANRLVRGKLEAAVVLVANDRSMRALPRGIKGRILKLVENGVDASVWEQREPCDGGTETHYIYVGRLVDWKGVDLLLRAFEGVAGKLVVVGDGPERGALEALTGALKVRHRVEFKGWLSQGDCARELRRCDVFVLPSLWECGGAVVLEAMCAGLPVVATNWGGPADYVDETCGILVEPHNEEAFVSGLRKAMIGLGRDQGLRERMGRAGREKILREYDWDRKGERMMEIYAEAVGVKHEGTKGAKTHEGNVESRMTNDESKINDSMNRNGKRDLKLEILDLKGSAPEGSGI